MTKKQGSLKSERHEAMLFLRGTTPEKALLCLQRYPFGLPY